MSPYIGYDSVSVTVPQLLNEYLQNKRVTSNGDYSIQGLMNNPSNYEGITKNSNIIVDIPQLDVTQISNYSITSNGNQNIPIPSGYDAVDSINVNVNIPNQTTIKVINANGIYMPPSPFIGFSLVTVDIPSSLVRGTFTSNGTYTPGSNFTGFYEVVVNVPSSTTTKTITSNGTYTPSSPYIGFSSVTVDVNCEVRRFRFKDYANSSQFVYVLFSDLVYTSTSVTINSLNYNEFILIIRKVSDGVYVYLDAEYGRTYPPGHTIPENSYYYYDSSKRLSYSDSIQFIDLNRNIVIYSMFSGKSDTRAYNRTYLNENLIKFDLPTPNP